MSDDPVLLAEDTANPLRPDTPDTPSIEPTLQEVTTNLLTEEEAVPDQGAQNELSPRINFNIVTGEYTGLDTQNRPVSLFDPSYGDTELTKDQRPIGEKRGWDNPLTAGRLGDEGVGYIEGGMVTGHEERRAAYSKELKSGVEAISDNVAIDKEVGEKTEEALELGDKMQADTKSDMVEYFADPMLGWWLGGLAGDAVYSGYLNRGGLITKQFLTDYAKKRSMGMAEVAGMQALKRFGPRLAGALTGTAASPVGTIAGLFAPELIPSAMDFLGGENNPDELRRYMTSVSPTDIGNMISNHEISMSMPNRNENPHDRSLMKYSGVYNDPHGNPTIGVGHLVKLKDQSWQDAFNNETNAAVKRVIAFKSGDPLLIEQLPSSVHLKASGEGKEKLTTWEIDDVFTQDLLEAFEHSRALGGDEAWGFDQMGHTDNSGVFNGTPRQAVIVDMTFNMGAKWWAPKLLTVREGDTLEIIAERNGITVEKLVKMNLKGQQKGLPGLQKVAPDKLASAFGDPPAPDSRMEIGNDKYGNGLLVGEKLIYNLGWPNFVKAMSKKDYETAADEMIDSAWYRQTGDRARKLVEMMRTGYFRDMPGIGQHGRPGVGSTIYDQADRVFNRPPGEGGVNPFLQTGVDEEFSLDPIRAGNNVLRNTLGEDGLGLPAFRWSMLQPWKW